MAERAGSRRPTATGGSGRPGRDDDRPARGYRPLGGRGEGAGHGAGHGRATEGVALEPVIEPPLPDSIEASSLDAQARRDLRGLAKDVAESVARHLVAAGVLVDDDPAQALEHARYARRRASRIAVVREAAGIAAYHAGEWAEALADLRAARRMGGGPGHLAVMADIERALGRPERAIEVARGPEAAELDRAAQVELVMVVAGARRDLGELEASVVGLQVPELDPARRDPWSARLFYAYADNLLAVGRESDAMQWFVHAVDADELGETDAPYRLADLTGEPPPEDDGIDFDVEDVVEADADGVAVADPPVSHRPAVVATTGVPDVVEYGVGSAVEPGAQVDAATSDAVVASVVAPAVAPSTGLVPSEVAGSSPDSEVGTPTASTAVDAETSDAIMAVVGDAIAEVQGSGDGAADAGAPADEAVPAVSDAHDHAVDQAATATPTASDEAPVPVPMVDAHEVRLASDAAETRGATEVTDR